MNAKPDFSKNANHAATAPAFFSVHDVHAYYGESYIVQGVSFNVHEGEILALLGRNGAGKTSTLRAIARTGSPMVTHGEIWLDHKPLHQMRSHEAASRSRLQSSHGLQTMSMSSRTRTRHSANSSPMAATPQST